eukprot:33377-Eustigmatos_ZCMA.PRE.1
MDLEPEKPAVKGDDKMEEDEETDAIELKDGDNEARRIFYEMIKNDIRYDSGRTFVRTASGIWTDDKELYMNILKDKALDANFWVPNPKGGMKPYSNDLNNATKIVKAMLTMLHRHENHGFINALW